MLKDSDSPHNALQSLCQWLSLPETQEVLQYLRDKAEVAAKHGTKTPISFVDRNGQQLSQETIRCLQDRFIGNAEGLNELGTFLENRQAELRLRLKQLEQDQQEQQVVD